MTAYAPSEADLAAAARVIAALCSAGTGKRLEVKPCSIMHHGCRALAPNGWIPAKGGPGTPGWEVWRTGDVSPVNGPDLASCLRALFPAHTIAELDQARDAAAARVDMLNAIATAARAEHHAISMTRHEAIQRAAREGAELGPDLEPAGSSK